MLTDQRGGLRLVGATWRAPGCWSSSSCRSRKVPAWSASPPVGRSRTSTWRRLDALAGSPSRRGGRFGATHALPLRLRGSIIGALNLFSIKTVPLSDDDVAVGQAMADVATIGLLHQRSLHEQTVLAEQLQTALQSRILIEQAKGVLAARAGLSVAEAFTRMRAHARRTSTSLTSIAQAVIEGTIDVDVLTPA